MNKTGALLINLGSPDNPRVPAVYRYLTEFLNDKRVINLPWLARKILVNLIIIPTRVFNSSRIYKKLWTSNGSPLIHYGQALVEAIRPRLEENNIHPYLAMRYGQPSIKSVVSAMEKQGFEKIIVLPLFPQYASASSGSAIQRALEEINKWWVIPDLEVVADFYAMEGYIDTIVERAQSKDLKQYDHILFSYHGLPVSHVDQVYPDGVCADRDCEHGVHGDNRFCYKAQCYETTRLIADKLNLGPEQYSVTFQSRLDKNWLEPFSDKVIVEKAKGGAKRLLVFSPAFVTDCLETTIEIGDEYLELFRDHGGDQLDLVESLNLHPMWVQSLQDMLIAHQ